MPSRGGGSRESFCRGDLVGYEPAGAKLAFAAWLAILAILAIFKADGYRLWGWCVVFVVLCFSVAVISARRNRP